MNYVIDTGRWLEPRPPYLHHAQMPHSSDLVRVVSVINLDGANTRCQCVTHHGETFECCWTWLGSYWQYAADADVLDSI